MHPVFTMIYRRLGAAEVKTVYLLKCTRVAVVGEVPR